jgi:hypothetical protein
MAALKLIEEARSAGLKLRAEGDRLVIRGPKSAEPIAKALLDRKEEILPFLQEQPAATIRPTPEPAPFHDDAREAPPAADSWLCPHCERPATIEDVDLSLDGQRMLTFWSCEPCGLAAVTPERLRQPPTGWVRRTEQ